MSLKESKFLTVDSDFLTTVMWTFVLGTLLQSGSVAGSCRGSTDSTLPKASKL